MAESYVEIPMVEFAGSPLAEGPGERTEYENGPADLIDDILDQISLHPGITVSNGCIRFPCNFNVTAEFYVSGLLNIQRNSDKVIQEFKNGPLVEIICPMIIPRIEIEFERPLTFCCFPICERACLTAATTTAELELSVFHGNIALDFVRIISFEAFEVLHTGSLSALWKYILKRKLLALERHQEEKIKESMAHFISKVVNKILRTYIIDENIRFRSLEE